MRGSCLLGGLFGTFCFFDFSSILLTYIMTISATEYSATPLWLDCDPGELTSCYRDTPTNCFQAMM